MQNLRVSSQQCGDPARNTQIPQIDALHFYPCKYPPDMRSILACRHIPRCSTKDVDLGQ